MTSVNIETTEGQVESERENGPFSLLALIGGLTFTPGYTIGRLNRHYSSMDKRWKSGDAEFERATGMEYKDWSEPARRSLFVGSAIFADLAKLAAWTEVISPGSLIQYLKI